VGDQLASEVAAHIQRHALLHAAEESAEARSRLTLARDLHDSVVQFLAGAAFRLEAMKRSSASGRDVDEELNELKQLMLQEQRELRSFITSLRSGPLAAFNDLARDLQTLAVHLSRQWDVHCEFSAHPADMMIPTRLRLDAHQLMREAVANAAMHRPSRSLGRLRCRTNQRNSSTTALSSTRAADACRLRSRNGSEQAGGALDMSRHGRDQMSSPSQSAR
jgi:signal transduction histidine kinase